MIHVYTGNGKGKTTAAFGLAMRAAGHGKKVAIVQFMKGVEYGEVRSAKKLGIEVYQFGRKEFVDPKAPTELDFKLAKEALKKAEELLKGDYDLVILDEVNVTVFFKLLKPEEVLKVLRERNERTEVVLTGRYAPPEFLEIADLVTEMREIKHYYRKGILAREGVEY